MKKLLFVLVAVPLLLTIVASLACAFTMSEKVVVANELVAIARVPAGGYTAQERIDKVNERLAYILGYEPLDPGSVYAVADGNSRVIMVGRTPLMTVTTSDAQANGTTVAGLARTWLRNAEMALMDARPTPSIPG